MEVSTTVALEEVGPVVVVVVAAALEVAVAAAALEVAVEVVSITTTVVIRASLPQEVSGDVCYLVTCCIIVSGGLLLTRVTQVARRVLVEPTTSRNL